MFKFKWLAVLAWFLVAVQPTFADDRAKLLGFWKLISFDMEFQDTGERRTMFGNSPMGYIILAAEGRMMAVIEGEGRKTPKTDEDRAVLHRTMVAYTGMYHLEGDKWITKVDVSWTPEWSGTEQVRFFKLEGDRLYVIGMWQTNPRSQDGRLVRSILAWERAK